MVGLARIHHVSSTGCRQVTGCSRPGSHLDTMKPRTTAAYTVFSRNIACLERAHRAMWSVDCCTNMLVYPSTEAQPDPRDIKRRLLHSTRSVRLWTVCVPSCPQGLRVAARSNAYSQWLPMPACERTIFLELKSRRRREACLCWLVVRRCREHMLCSGGGGYGYRQKGSGVGNKHGAMTGRIAMASGMRMQHAAVSETIMTSDDDEAG
jgi:hypothetical protein